MNIKTFVLKENDTEINMLINVNIKGFFKLIVSNDFYSSNFESDTIFTGPEVKGSKILNFIKGINK